jgi:hypothetical protein
MTKPEMTDEQRDDMLANREHPTVTKETIEAKIKEVSYAVQGVHTICYLTLQNGFTVTGQSACADPRNFNEELGRKIAYDNAFREIWPLEGYLLKEKLWTDANKASDPAPATGEGEQKAA